ncbi:hypothetical protein AYL99_06619 [Fonsecaea erecta]|uniref:Uncharacterized protein n=1 Tax=Fonsecaea erecta TaxID=1367422 RepID=A0A178ZIJ7_9EURO|nr:hypothetical protein AYL99_06619 [Fonsecaea erecta]OAP59321.1 hypothetical protein AYL99_06619 [Fonsecaea erecta]
MVPFEDILLNNTSLLSPGSGPVCVLVGSSSSSSSSGGGGGTNDGIGIIGLATLRAVLRHTSCPTIYLVAEGDHEGLHSLVAAVQSLNQSATLVPIASTGDLARVSSAQDAAQAIVAADPPRVDILIMASSATSARYYAPHMRILVTLLPLLRRARSPRVVSVLSAGGGGGRDASLLEMNDVGMMTTLFFEHLARQPENDKIVLLRVDAGLDDVNVDEAGERVLFAATNGRFRRVQDPERAVGTLIQQGSDGVLGSGVYLVNADSSVVAVIQEIQDSGGGDEEMDVDAARQKVWEYTMGELERIERM